MQEKLFEILFGKDEITWQSMIYEAVRSEQMDPWDIDMKDLASKFLEMLSKLKEMDFKVSGKMVLAAAILLRIKSHKLVTDDLNQLDRLIAMSGETEEDFYNELLGGGADEHTTVVNVGDHQIKLVPRTPQPRKRKVSVYDLVEALEKALEVKNRRRVLDRDIAEEIKVPENYDDINVIIQRVYAQLKDYFTKRTDAQKIKFSELVGSDNREERIFTFYPLLHLSTQRHVDLVQEVPFEDFDIYMLNAETPLKIVEEPKPEDIFAKEKKAQKKGQLSVFILLGFSLFIIIGALVYGTFFRAEKMLPPEFPNDAKALQVFVEQCIEAVTVSGAYLLGSQGGFISVPENSLKTDFGNIAYGYDQGMVTLIAKKSLEQQLSEYLRIQLPFCFGNFSSFSGEVISSSDPQSVVALQQEKILVEVEYPLTMRGTTVETFKQEVNVPLGAMYDEVFMEVNRLVQNPDWVDLTELQEGSFKSSVVPYDEETLLFTFERGDLVFLFAAKFKKNTPPKLQLEQEYYLQEKERFTLTIPYQDEDPVTFADDSPLFTISPEGVIDAIPEIPGTFIIEISAKDTAGNIAKEQVTFIVEENG